MSRPAPGHGSVPRAPSMALLIDREVDALDRLAAEVRGGIRGATHFDQLEERAQAISQRLVKAFRGRGATSA